MALKDELDALGALLLHVEGRTMPSTPQGEALVAHMLLMIIICVSSYLCQRSPLIRYCAILRASAGGFWASAKMFKY